jgi:hypothetical protein
MTLIEGFLSVLPMSGLFLFATLVFCFALAPSVASTREYRSLEVKHEFQRLHSCSATGQTSGACPGYNKDHIVPLACGGPDAVANLQWQTTAAAKARIKDKWERKACGR